MSDSGGDLEFYLGLSKAWVDRKHWPTMTQERFADFDVSKITEFLRQATLHSRKKYFSEEAWEKLWKRSTPESIAQRSLDWLTLYCEAGSMLEEDPASDKAQAFLDRWLALGKSTSGGDPEIRAGWMREWADRQNSPALIRKTRALLGSERVIKFISATMKVHMTRPAMWNFRDYYQVWAQVLQRQEQQLDPPARVDHLLARIKLFGNIAASEEGITKSWEDRRNWPPILRRSMASHLRMDFETIDKVVEFIGKAVAHRNP